MSNRVGIAVICLVSLVALVFGQERYTLLDLGEGTPEAVSETGVVIGSLVVTGPDGVRRLEAGTLYPHVTLWGMLDQGTQSQAQDIAHGVDRKSTRLNSSHRT